MILSSRHMEQGENLNNVLVFKHLIKYGTHACVPEEPCQFLRDQGQT